MIIERWSSVCGRRRVLRIIFAACVGLSLVAAWTPAWAQTGALGTIHGTVTDESGGALPGVNVTLTSQALQVGKVSNVTEPDGTYRFADLPVGTYKITFELQGFKTFIRDEVRLPVGFVARIDATMAVGGVEESVTVSGVSPVVDQTTTTTSVNITLNTLEAVPIGRGYQHLFAMTPGVTTAGAPDVGDSSMASRNDIQNYGVTATAKMEVEGMNISIGPSSGVYYTTFAFEEVQIKTSGNDAEVSTPGISMVSVMKSGSNQFHGSYSASGQRPELQSSNYTPKLQAQGLSQTPPLRHYYDVAGDLGGRLIKDKLWFFVGANKQQRLSGILGFVAGPGPDGKYLTGDEPTAYYENNLTNKGMKVSYQATQNNRLVAVWAPMLKYQPQRDADRFRPLESTTDYRNPGGIYKGEIQSTISPRIVLDVTGGYGGNRSDYSAIRSHTGAAVLGNPNKLDRETGLHFGSSEHNSRGYSDRWQSDAGLSFFPEHFLGGHHEMKVGTTGYWERNGTSKEHSPAGDYTLVYDKINGVSGTPTEIDIFSTVFPVQWVTHYAGYVKDTWRVSDSLTLNLGVRYERQHAYIPQQSRAASLQFPALFPAGSFATINVLTWTSVVPRFGLAWSLGPKTVVKMSAGRYNAGMSSDFASRYNNNAPATAIFRWSDPDRNGDYTPGEVNLDLNGPDFLSITAASNNVNAPNLRQPMTNEATAGFERELRKNLGFRALYVFKNFVDQFAATNILRPRSAYDIPITRRDPGPDGVLSNGDDGGKVTIYDYNAAYRGAAFVGNQLQNSARTDWYQSVEFTLTKRTADRWFGMASFWATRRHRWLTLIPDNPNNDYFPLDQSWTWAANVSGSYRLPGSIQVGAYLQTKIGYQGQKTYTFRATDPDGGTPLRQLSTVTVNLEPYGKEQGPAIRILDLRASKQFALGSGQKFEVDFDLFNLLNSSAPTTITFVEGPTYGYYGLAGASVNAAEGGILPGRVARFGAKYSF